MFVYECIIAPKSASTRPSLKGVGSGLTEGHPTVLNYTHTYIYLYASICMHLQDMCMYMSVSPCLRTTQPVDAAAKRRLGEHIRIHRLPTYISVCIYLCASTRYAYVYECIIAPKSASTRPSPRKVAMIR